MRNNRASRKYNDLTTPITIKRTTHKRFVKAKETYLGRLQEMEYKTHDEFFIHLLDLFDNDEESDKPKIMVAK